MQLMTARPGDWQALAELSGEVKQFAADVERPILMASQLNRTSGTSSDAGAEAISGSDNIGMDADLIMFIQDYSKRTRRCKVIKNRHGEKDVVWYTEFDPNVGLFREIGKQRADDLKDEDKDYA